MLPIAAPDDYVDMLAPLPNDVRFEKRPGPVIDLAHVFADRRSELRKHLVACGPGCARMPRSGFRGRRRRRKSTTDITEDTIREVALPLGFVDIKVCAVSEVWSGLKLVVRKELR